MIEMTWSGLTSDLVVSSVVKGAGVLVAAAVAVRLLRRQPASVRHGVWLAALAAQLLIPLFSATLPAWRLELPAWASAVADRNDTSADASDVSPPAVAAGVVEAREVTPAPNAARAGDAPAELPYPDATRFTFETFDAWSTGELLVAVWAVGATIILLRLVIGVGAVALLARRARRVKDADWLVLATELSEEMGLARPVILLRGGPLSVPVTWGVLVPALLLPPDADEWSDERRRTVLLHELAHVRRHDAFAQLVAYLVLAVCWFNPLVWLAVRSMRSESERACDDCVLRHGTEPSAYVQDLLAIVRATRNRRTPPALAALAMARPTEFEGRVLAILDASARRNAAGRFAKALTAVGAIGLVAPLAAMRPVAATPTSTALAVTPADPSVARAVRAALGGREAPAPRAGETVESTTTPRANASAGASAGAAASLQPPVRGGMTPTPMPTPTPTPMPMPSGKAHRGWDNVVGGLLKNINVDWNVKVDPKVSVSPKITLGKGWGGDGSGGRAGGDSASVAGLAAALADSDTEVRQSAAHALGSLQDARAVDALAQALRRDTDAQVRSTAAWALGQIEDRRAVPALSEALRDDRAVEVRRQAAWALGQIEDAGAVDALGAALRDADAGVRRQAVWALGQIEDPRSVAPLLPALSSEDVEVRKQAAWALGQIESRDATAALGAALRDRDAGVRSQAAWALGQIEDPASVAALAAALRDSAASVRKQAAWALGQVESPGAVPGLTAALRDADRGVRQTAAWALAQIEDPAAVPGLIELTRSDDVELRRSGAYALSQIRGVAATEALLALLKDPDPTVRRHAARALGDR